MENDEVKLYKVRRISDEEKVIRVPAEVSGYFRLIVQPNGDLLFVKAVV